MVVMQTRVLGLALALVAVVDMAPGLAGQQPPRPASPAGVEASSISVPDDYVIGAEDVIGVLFWREPEMSGDVTVRPDGKITLPLIGEMMAVGLKPEVLRDEVKKAAERFLTDANVSVVVKQINSRKVFITGQVAHPGAFPLTSPRTVLQLIALAGGLTEYAEGDKITVMRTEQGQTKVLRFNYKDVSKGKALEQNVQLMPGDTVVVP
jgi:polysaccharide export outer membrane protein